MSGISVPRKGPQSETVFCNSMSRRELFRSIAAMAALGQGQVSIARNYGLRPSEVFDALVEEAQMEREEARREGYREGRRSAIPIRRTA